MDPSNVVVSTALAIASHLAAKGTDITLEKAKELVQGVVAQKPTLDNQINIDAVAEEVLRSSAKVGRVTYNQETLARYLEIPLSDLATLSQAEIEVQTLYDHVRLENEFEEWLMEWGYDVQIGPELQGLHGVEYSPDVYGILNTLHGEFEICVNFVCDEPPNEFRVLALLNNIEAYAEAKTSFSHGDVFILATPSKFTHGAMNSIGLQNLQEAYSVFPMEGGDIYVLENARNPKDRLAELQDKVREAQANYNAK